MQLTHLTSPYLQPLSSEPFLNPQQDGVTVTDQYHHWSFNEDSQMSA